MVILAALTAAAVMMQAAPASGPTPPSPGSTASPVTVIPKAPEAVEVQKHKLVCRDEQVLGTLFPKKICATAEELSDRRLVDQAEVRKAQALRPFKVN